MEILKIKTNDLNNSITKFLFKGIFLLTLFSGNKAQADDTMCYEPSNIGSVGDAGTVCANMLIVDRALLDEGIADGKTGTNNSTFKITKNGTTYNFKDKVFTGQVTDFSNLFNNKQSFNAPIGNWDTSNATKMNGMFLKAKKFNQDISNWNVAKVTNMNSMFKTAADFNQDISSWDVSSVTTMKAMFHNAYDFDQGLNDWAAKTGNVTNMMNMFRSAKNFNKHIQNWDVSNVTNMKNMFHSAESFNKTLNNWNRTTSGDESSTAKVESMQNMFRDATSFNNGSRNKLNFNVTNVQDFRGMFRNAVAFNQNISDWTFDSDSESITMGNFLNGADAFAKDLRSWNVTMIPNKPNNFYTKNPVTSGYEKPCWGKNGCPPEDTIPKLISMTPSGITNISPNDPLNLVLEFDRNIEATSNKKDYIILRQANVNSSKLRTFDINKLSNLKPTHQNYVDIDGTKITLKNIHQTGKGDPLPLVENGQYYIEIKPGAIQSTDGEEFPGLSGNYQDNGDTWFTIAENAAPLEIIGTTPTKDLSEGKLSLNNDPNIKIQFSENIDYGSTGSIILKKYSDQTNVIVFDVSNSSDQNKMEIVSGQLTINLDSSLLVENTKYFLHIDSGAIKKSTSTDVFSGIDYNDNYSFSTIADCGEISGRAKYWKGQGASSTTVKIYKGDTLVATETTNQLGDYSFFPTEEGTYKVEFVKPTSGNNSTRFTRAALLSNDSGTNSGRWVKNIEITQACDEHTEIDGFLIDPKGIIYNSKTREPISGATVNFLYNGELVNNDWLDDSGGQNSQITGADGEYSFILRADTASNGTYTIQVLPPNKYKFESTQIPSETNTYTPQLGAQIDEIQPQETAPDSDQDTTYYLNFNFVFVAGDSSSTSNGVINNHIPIDPFLDPTTKADVNGLAEAWTDAAIRFNKSSVKAVNKRFDWLRRNQKSEKKSHQGINISFANPLLEKALNGNNKRFKDLESKDLENWAQTNWSNERLKNESDQVFNDLIDNSVNLAFAELREKTFKPNLNPTGGELIGDWSLWSSGEILVGDFYSTTTSSGQDSDSIYLTFGMDKPYKDNGLFGIAFTYGDDDIRVGNAGSGINSTNYGLNVYSSNLLKNKLPLETQFGLGMMDIATKRIDDSSLHKGNRKAYMIFGSAKLLAEPFNIKNFQLTPYGRLDLAHIKFNEFSESGSNLALTFKDQTINRKMISLGLNLDRNLTFENWRLKPFLGISYGYDFTGDSIVDMNYVGDSQNYRIILDKLSSEQWNTSLGFEFYRNNNWSGSVSYEYEKSDSSSHSNSYQFNLNWYF